MFEIIKRFFSIRGAQIFPTNSLENEHKASSAERSPIRMTVLANDTELLEELSVSPVKLKAVTANRETVLHYLCHHNQPTWVSKLAASEIKINARNKEGMTAVHTAILYQQEAMVEALSQQGADLNAVTTTRYIYNPENDNTPITIEKGSTALHIAVLIGSVRGTQQLIDKKVSIELRDSKGRTPQDIAIANSAIDEILKKRHIRILGQKITESLEQYSVSLAKKKEQERKWKNALNSCTACWR